MAYGQPWTQPGRRIIDNSMLAGEARRNAPRVDVPAFNATVTLPLYTFADAAEMEKIVINSDTATTGSDAGNKYEFMLRNETQGQDMMSAEVSTEIVANQNVNCAANDVIVLVITKTGTRTNLSIADLYATFVFKAN